MTDHAILDTQKLLAKYNDDRHDDPLVSAATTPRWLEVLTISLTEWR